MEALDILEKRIEFMTRILGPLPEGVDTPDGSKANSTEGENIVDSLISAHTLLNGATKEREEINKAIMRAPELETYLDPNFLEENQQVRAKEVYVNTVAPQLHAKFEQLAHIKEMEPTLGAEYFRNIPGECTDKLKQVAVDNNQFAQQSELIEESLILAMKRYGEIQADLMTSLNAMSKRLEAVENKIQLKKRDDLDKELPVDGADEQTK